MPRTAKPTTPTAAAAKVKPTRAAKPRQLKGGTLSEAKAPAVPPISEPPAAQAARMSKVDAVIALLRRPEGVSVDEVMAITGWQRHSVRGAFAGVIKKKLGAAVVSKMIEGVRRYRAPEASA